MTELVKRSVAGDADAFLELMEQNTLSMYKIARSILNNDEDAADVIQSTILICFEKIHTLKKPEYFKTWMTRILINECTKILRHYRSTIGSEILPELPDSDMSLAEFEFKEMLDQVDEKYRTVLILYYVEGYQISQNFWTQMKIQLKQDLQEPDRKSGKFIPVRIQQPEPLLQIRKGVCHYEKNNGPLFRQQLPNR